MRPKRTLEDIELIISRKKRGEPTEEYNSDGYNIVPGLGQSIVIFIGFSALAVFVMTLDVSL